jgi:hypothetical protein
MRRTSRANEKLRHGRETVLSESALLVHWPETAFWEMAPPCTCRESPCDQENTRCWKMTVARGSEMKAQIEPLVETDCR